MKERKLQVRRFRDSLILYKDLLDEVEYEPCGLEEELIAKTVRIAYPGGEIFIPATFEILQTEDGEVAFVEVDNPLPIPYYIVDGITAINEISEYKVYLSKEKERWTVPSLPRRHYLVLENGMVVDPNPYQYGKRRTRK